MRNFVRDNPTTVGWINSVIGILLFFNWPIRGIDLARFAVFILVMAAVLYFTCVHNRLGE